MEKERERERERTSSIAKRAIPTEELREIRDSIALGEVINSGVI